MENEICTIDLRKDPFFDDDYTFYEDGKIKRFYDKSSYRHSLESWLKPEEITDETKQLLLDKCPENFKEKIRSILNGHD